MKARRFDLWRWAGAVSIRTKIMGIVAAAILLVSLAMVWYAYHDMSVILRNELEQLISKRTGIPGEQ